ncbi:dTDP-4-dehydrorhamnose 3,5-epimerase [Parvibaculum sp.]|uniref:dTDP-4-dehydrorhamnose 3,5-epimerase n=1 Tax=Parvibaculum sp. TaxID=2024848 RepID=UPI00391B4880
MNSIQSTSIPAVKILTPRRHGDARGYFSESYNRRALADAGIDIDFVQDNESLSAETGTIRGLHFQAPPFEQTKLVRVLTGAVLDVALDLRVGSPTYGQHVAVRLSAEEGNQLLIPAGFAHGFCTLAPDTRVFYKVDQYYSAAHDAGLFWNDPDIGIEWPVSSESAVLSEKDSKLPAFEGFRSPFAYQTL